MIVALIDDEGRAHRAGETSDRDLVERIRTVEENVNEGQRTIVLGRVTNKFVSEPGDDDIEVVG